MSWWLAVRDNDAQKPVSVDETDEAKMEAAYAAARQKYPPPQYDLVLANAPNLEAFLKNYPKFQGAAPTDSGGGTSAGKTPTPSTPPSAKPTA
jgi:hypothetical protein